MTENADQHDISHTDGTSGRAQAISVTAASRQYADLVSGGNQRWIGTPESIRIVTSTRQAVLAVQESVDHHKRLSMRSSGHCFEDFVFNADVQIVLDMSEMDDVYYDQERRAVVIEPGATTLEAYETMYREWGVTIPAGFCYSVAMGGHVSGGAWGPLCRLHGLVVDHLYAVEVVVVDAAGKARAVIATSEKDDPHRDLWWAHTGGGGGNFGVVTRYWFRSPGATGHHPSELLPKPPAELLVNAVSWPWSELSREEFGRLARNYAGWHVANLAPDSPRRDVTSLMVLSHRSAGQIGMLTLVDSSVPHAEDLLESYLEWMNDGISVDHGAFTAPLGELPALPQFAAARRLPWLQATRMIALSGGALNDPTLRADYKSTYMRGNFPEGQLDALYKQLTRDDVVNPNLAIQLTPYGGRINAISPSATAASHRGAAFKMLWMALWNDETDDDKYVNWLREGYQEAYADTGGVPVPNSVTDGCYVNYPDIDLSDPRFNKSSVPWHDLYYKDNYPRLQRIKQKWDPRNTFRHGQSIEFP